jgi:hypothetical protein
MGASISLSRFEMAPQITIIQGPILVSELNEQAAAVERGLADASSQVVIDALQAIAWRFQVLFLGRASEDVVPKIIQLLGHRNDRVRRVACDCLYPFAERAWPALPRLLAMAASDSDDDVRLQALRMAIIVGRVCGEELLLPRDAELLTQIAGMARSLGDEALPLRRQIDEQLRRDRLASQQTLGVPGELRTVTSKTIKFTPTEQDILKLIAGRNQRMQRQAIERALTDGDGGGESTVRTNLATLTRYQILDNLSGRGYGFPGWP